MRVLSVYIDIYIGYYPLCAIMFHDNRGPPEGDGPRLEVLQY